MRVLVSVLVAAGAVYGQKPVIKPNGVVNAASYSGRLKGEAWMARYFFLDPPHLWPYSANLKGEALVVGGSIFTIFGENLAASEQKAPGTPLPTTLAGTSVTVGGIAAPLFYVSATQINFQVPNAVSRRVGERIPVVVTTAAGPSEPVFAFVQEDSPGIFSQDGSGCGPGVIQNVAADGSVTLNTPSNSASPGSFITIYGTGLGPLRNPPADGYPAQVEPLTGTGAPQVRFGIDGFRFSLAQSVFAALTPGLVGVSQVNLPLPEDAFEGCAVPLRLILSSWPWSPPVTLSIRKGGGPCQDEAHARFATLQWRKVITSSPEHPSGVAEATFTASFASAPENLAVPFPDPPDPLFLGCPCGGLGTPMSPRCKGAGLSALDAGRLRIEGIPGGPLAVQPSPSDDGTNYRTPLPPESLEGGPLRVTSDGGADVGSFATEVTMPPPIQVTTPLAPGTVIDFTRPFTVTWSGGSADTLVTLKLIAYQDQEERLGVGCTCPGFGNVGAITLGMFSPYSSPILLIGARSEYVEAVLTVTPLVSKLTRFSAPGLTREGRHQWSYEYRFKGLKIR